MKEKILIVDDDPDTLRLMGLMLQRHGYLISTATSGEQGLALALSEKPDLIVLDIMMPDLDGYEVARRLRKDPATAPTPILMFTAKSQIDDKVVGFEAGADAYITKPTHPTDLHAQVSALLQQVAERNTGQPSGAAAPRGFVIGVLAVRGGLGASSVAANLAAGLRSLSGADVILAELTPGQGTLGMELGAQGQQALKELLQASPSEIGLERVQASLIPHASGMRLLLASENPVDVNLTSRVENYDALLRQLSTLAEYIVVDFGTGLPDSVQQLLPKCDEHIIVLDGTANTIRQAKILIQEIARLGIAGAAISVVLNNRTRTEALMSREEMQAELGHSISAALAADPDLFQQAARTHAPAVLSQPNNLTSQQFLKLAELMTERRQAR
jgi:CheY-like chemotaxis protein